VKTRLSKKIFLLSLAALMLFNGIGFYALAYLQTGLHRACLFENSGEKQNLVLDARTFSSVSWIGKTDFIYNGTVYDCEQITSSHGKIFISCYADKEETVIKNSVADSFDSNPAKSSSSSKELLKFFPVFPLTGQQTITPDLSCKENQQPGLCKIPLSILHREISSPPPELV
jgi:hypothetical protein